MLRCRAHRLFAAALSVHVGLTALGAQALAEPLTVAVNKDDRPYAYLGDTGELEGFSVDTARALCEAMAAACTLVSVPFAEFVPGVAEGRFDFAAANILRTPEREKAVDFSERVWRSSSTFVGRPGAVPETTVQGLRGKTVATQQGTVQERYLRQTYGDAITLKLYASNVEHNAALAEGKADLTLGSITASFAFLNTPRGSAFEIIGQPMYGGNLGGDVAIPLAKGRDDLRQRINAAIATIREDGTFERISRKYFPVSVQ